jgi:hypothetical protein
MFLFVISLFISLNLQGVYDGPELAREAKYTMYSIDDTNFILTADSLYSYNKQMGWSSRKHSFKLESYNLDELKDKEKTYLIIRGLGKVYKAKKDTVFSIDNSFEWKSRYSSSLFIRKGVIHSYGGYGFYSSKNNIVYFDSSSKEWSMLKQKNLNPLSNTSRLSKYDSIEDVFYTTFGTQNRNGIEFYNYKTVKFDFKTLNWIEVSELDKRIMDFIQKKTGTIIPNYPEASLINRDYFSEIDFINDEFRVYDIHNNIIENRRNIIYNEVKNEFFVAFENNYNNKLNFAVIKKYDLLGEKFSTYNLHKKKYYAYYALGAIILIIIYVVFFFRKKSIYDLIKNKKGLDSELDEIEKKLKDKLIDIYPRELTYPEISILLDFNLSYESNIKKTQKTINHLEFKIQRSLKTKSSVFETSRNEFDKRIKQVRII